MTLQSFITKKKIYIYEHMNNVGKSTQFIVTIYEAKV